MKRIATLLALVVLPVAGLLAQDIKELKHQEKKELRKKEQQQYDSTSYANAIEALSAQTWVLEAYMLRGKRGNTFQVNSTLNFVMVNKGKGTVQLGSPYRAGYNGLGGITVEGNISGYKLETDKHGNVSVRFMVVGIGINAEIFINLNVNSNRAEADISPNTWGRRITYIGNIIPLEDSNVFKGMPL
jgi:hypothetical protein